jgi:hypothetical protein
LKKRELVMTFKAVRSFAPEYLSNLFMPATFNNDYSLRSNNRNLCLKNLRRILWKIVSLIVVHHHGINYLCKYKGDNYNQLSIDSFKSTINGYFMS